MIKVSAAEFQRNIGRYQDMALVQPVAVTRNGRERTVMISVEEYHRLKRRDRQVLGLEDFTDADVAALEETRAPDSSDLSNPGGFNGGENGSRASRLRAVASRYHSSVRDPRRRGRASGRSGR